MTYNDIKSQDEFIEADNIQQIPNMEIENFFTRAINSYTVIKQEEFKVVKQNYESNNSDSTQIVKTLRDELHEFDDFENTGEPSRQEFQTETETTITQEISNSQVLNITPTNSMSITASDSGTEDCIMEPQFPKFGSSNYFPTWLFNNMVPEEVNQPPADITRQKIVLSCRGQ